MLTCCKKISNNTPYVTSCFDFHSSGTAQTTQTELKLKSKAEAHVQSHWVLGSSSLSHGIITLKKRIPADGKNTNGCFTTNLIAETNLSLKKWIDATKTSNHCKSVKIMLQARWKRCWKQNDGVTAQKSGTHPEFFWGSIGSRLVPPFGCVLACVGGLVNSIKAYFCFQLYRVDFSGCCGIKVSM